MSTSIMLSGVSKVFSLAEAGGGPVSLREALRSGERKQQFREVHALRQISFEARDGERIGIIGRNGAGKTTLLSILAGITSPSSGSLAVSGDVHAMLTIGAVLRDEATGRENILLDGTFHGKSREEVEARAEDIIAFSELGDFIDRPVRTYSSGMKARLAFSMGAFVDPDILIIDETLSVGDVFFSAKAGRRMKEIAARGRIVILVSHALGSIVELCDRCIWLDQGRIVMDGDPKEVTSAYQRAVEQADESELARKFGAPEPIIRRPDAGNLTAINLLQEGTPLGATARAFLPLELAVSGRILTNPAAVDMELSIVRVDGRQITRRRLSEQAAPALPGGLFEARVRMDPFLLGQNLYRIDVRLLDQIGLVDSLSRVIEVLDEEGQFGGVPVLYHPPLISAHRIGDLPQ